MSDCPPLLCVDLIWGQLLAHGLLLQNSGESHQNHDYFQSKPEIICITTTMRRAGPLAASDTFILAGSDEGENRISSQGGMQRLSPSRMVPLPVMSQLCHQHLCGHVQVSPELGKRFSTLCSPPGCCSHGQQPRP